MVARTDDLIVRFGGKLFTKTSRQSHHHQYIKQKMRELARFLITMRKMNPKVSSLSDCIDPTQFSDVIKAVKEQCNYDPKKGRYTIPSLALKIGHSLKKCSKYLKSKALEMKDVELRGRCDDFIELMNNEWGTEIGSQALSTLHVNAFNKPKRIPLAKDIRKMNVHLREMAEEYMNAIQEKITHKSYQNLAYVSIAQLVLFNRRRGGEVERMKLKEFQDGISAGKQQMQEEVEASLSSFEKELAAKLLRIEIQGKRGRKIPVLLTATVKQQLDLLVSARSRAGISEYSKYLFARPGTTRTPYRSSCAIAKFANECGAEQPGLLQSTRLRFHVATVSQLLNLKENELDVLAGFMGHDLNIHRKFYRLPEDTMQLAKVSKILVHMEKGTIQHFKGKSLDEIQLCEDETLSDEDDILPENRNQENDMCDSDQDLPETISEDDETMHPENDHDQPGDWKEKKSATKKAHERKPWSKGEKTAVQRQLGKFLRLGTIPGKQACETAKENEPSLRNRSWKHIKFCVKNMNSKKNV